jgi:hypothetical protein
MPAGSTSVPMATKWRYQEVSTSSSSIEAVLLRGGAIVDGRRWKNS